MKILSKYNTLFTYKIQPFYFESNSEITSTQSTSSSWRVGAGGSYVLLYEVFFYAKNPSSEDFFVMYQKKYELQCLIENVEADAQEIIQFKESILLSAKLFLMENVQNNYHLLNFRMTSVLDEKLKDQHAKVMSADVLSEIINLKRIMGILTLEEMSEEERIFTNGSGK